MSEKSLIEQVDEILLVDAKRRIVQLEKEISDWRDTFRIVLADECAPDERHCTCVPFLRDRIAQLEEENAALKREIEELCPEIVTLLAQEQDRPNEVDLLMMDEMDEMSEEQSDD